MAKRPLGLYQVMLHMVIDLRGERLPHAVGAHLASDLIDGYRRFKDAPGGLTGDGAPGAILTPDQAAEQRRAWGDVRDFSTPR
jgi:hypothetical protein